MEAVGLRKRLETAEKEVANATSDLAKAKADLAGAKRSVCLSCDWMGWDGVGWEDCDCKG